jgi:hypothetical protein
MDSMYRTQRTGVIERGRDDLRLAGMLVAADLLIAAEIVTRVVGR